MFFLIMTGYILMAYLIFPVEDNIWKVPDYYLAISVLTSSAFVVLYERWQKRRKPKHLPNEPLVISDELLEPAASTVITTGQASISMIQRRLGVSYTRGAELMDLLEQLTAGQAVLVHDQDLGTSGGSLVSGAQTSGAGANDSNINFFDFHFASSFCSKEPRPS